MLTHVDAANRPTMVDVGDKAVTTRTAVARAVVVFPADVVLRSGDVLRTKKGPVFDTAIIAGVMAAKKTHDLIPFCHPLPLEDCKIAIEWGEGNETVIECSVRATHKTGVEMEALTGATVRGRCGMGIDRERVTARLSGLCQVRNEVDRGSKRRQLRVGAARHRIVDRHDRKVRMYRSWRGSSPVARRRSSGCT